MTNKPMTNRGDPALF